MNSALELYDSRIDHIDLADGVAALHFSHAYIHKSKGPVGLAPGTGWSQEARLVLEGATLLTPIPDLPQAIMDGFIEVGGIRHEMIPLPFRRKVGARLCLSFSDGHSLTIVGERPYIELLGQATFLEEF